MSIVSGNKSHFDFSCRLKSSLGRLQMRELNIFSHILWEVRCKKELKCISLLVGVFLRQNFPSPHHWNKGEKLVLWTYLEQEQDGPFQLLPDQTRLQSLYILNIPLKQPCRCKTAFSSRCTHCCSCLFRCLFWVGSIQYLEAQLGSPD